MSDLIQELEKAEFREDSLDFAPGDTVRVLYNVREGSKERIQVFEGVCIGRRGSGMGATFTVRKISSGIGVERVFPLHAPTVTGVEVIRRGRVRRAKLYYMRGLRGKAARIKERRSRWGKATPQEKRQYYDARNGHPARRCGDRATNRTHP